MKNIIELCKKAVTAAGRKNIDEYEVFIASSIHNEIEVFNGNVENLSFANTKGIGFRVFKEKRMGYAYTSNVYGQELEKCLEKAIENSKITGADDYNFLPSAKDYNYPASDIDRSMLFSERIYKYSTADKINIAKHLESIAKKKDKRISGVSELIYNDNISEIAIINSNGFEDSYRTSSAFIYLGLISRSGQDTSTGDYFGYERCPQDIDIESIAENAASRSVKLLGAKKIKSQSLDLLLDPFVSVQFLQVIAGITCADAVQKGKSLFAGKIGSKVFSKDFNIFDDGTLKSGMASKPFDAEGVPKGKTAVFEKGVLKSYLYNTYTARKDDTRSTGNASRSSYKTPPETGISNFYIEPSKITVEEIQSKITRGFYVMDIIGLHSGINPISGQISVGAKGIFIENGEKTFPVKEVTIATDILSFCSSLSEVADDLKFMPASGYVGSPSMLLNNITLSGI